MLSFKAILCWSTFSLAFLCGMPYTDLGAAPAKKRSTSALDQGSAKAATVQAYGKLPLSFETNQGQIEESVRFVSRGPRYTLFLTGTDAVLSLRQRRSDTAAEPSDELFSVSRRSLRIHLIGAADAPRISGREPLPGTVNYFIGNDPRQWRTKIPTYARVHYKEVYPGIDLTYYGNQGKLEYDFIVSPGTDPSQIRLRFAGADKLELDDNGNLAVHIDGGELLQAAPIVYQQPAGSGSEKQFVEGRYLLAGNGEVSFELAAYDVDRPLIIDPTLEYSTFLGGTARDRGEAIALGHDRSAYVTGTTSSVDFPTQDPEQPASAGSFDAFITKLNPAGTALVYSTYFGGGGVDVGQAIAVDHGGNAYVTGAPSADFPTTAGSFNSTFTGPRNAFVLKLDTEGKLVYSGLISGSSSDESWGIAVDSDGNVYVTGSTDSGIFPTTPGAFQEVFGGNTDAFVTKVSADGSQLVYSSYLGGSGTAASGRDRGMAIAVDEQHNAYVTGWTGSTDFPTTLGAYQTTLAAPGADVFVTKLNAEGSDLIYSTYVGGSGADRAFGIALDVWGSAFITGGTVQTDYPTTPDSFQPVKAGSPGFTSSFVTKLNPQGSDLMYSSFLGGSNTEHGAAIAVDLGGNAYATGWTASTDFPIVNPLPGGEEMEDGDVYVSKVNFDGSALVYSTYLGGSESDRTGGDSSGPGGNLVAVDSLCNAYLTGRTMSADFPTETPFQATYGGGFNDGFVTKIGPTITTDEASINCSGILLANLAPTINMMSPNALFTVFGINFALPGTFIDGGELDENGRLSTLFGNTCLEVNGMRSPVIQVLAGQVSGQAPHALPPGYASVRVIRDCGTGNEIMSAAEYVQVEEYTPAFFVHFSTLDEQGNALIIATHEGTSDVVGAPGVVPGASGGAVPGSFISMWGTGFGLTEPPFESGQLPGMAAVVPGVHSVRLGDMELPLDNILYIGAAPCCAGLYQVIIIIPDDLPPGVYTVVVTVNGVSSTPLGPYIVVG